MENADVRHPWRIDYPVQLDTPAQAAVKNGAGGDEHVTQCRVDRIWSEVQAKNRAGLGWKRPLFTQVCEALPVEPLMQLIDANPDWWQQITIRQQFLGSAHHATQSIHLRGPTSFTFDDVFLDTASLDYPLLARCIDALMPVLRPLLRAIQWRELGRVLIVRLPAGAQLDEHVDEGRYAKHFARFHVPLRTNEQSALVVEDSHLLMPAGEAWWFNHRRSHWAYNAGETDRVHLIVDAVSPLFTVE